jgi:hypothetical protein
VGECVTHLECVLDDATFYGPEALIIRRVVAVSIDDDFLVGAPAERYERLAPVFFLEEATYAGLSTIRRVSMGDALACDLSSLVRRGNVVIRRNPRNRWSLSLKYPKY